jgi:hypothetical protein
LSNIREQAALEYAELVERGEWRSEEGRRALLEKGNIVLAAD